MILGQRPYVTLPNPVPDPREPSLSGAAEVTPSHPGTAYSTGSLRLHGPGQLERGPCHRCECASGHWLRVCASGPAPPLVGAGRGVAVDAAEGVDAAEDVSLGRDPHQRPVPYHQHVPGTASQTGRRTHQPPVTSRRRERRRRAGEGGERAGEREGRSEGVRARK